MKYITVTWIEIQNQYDQCLGWKRKLYAYYDSTGYIYYIGKADDQTVRERLQDPDKARMVGVLTRSGGQIGNILCGIIHEGDNYSLSSSVISNAEALLIRTENPWGNTVKPSISEDIHVTCDGYWRGKQSVYQHRGLARMPHIPLARPFPEVPIKRIGRMPDAQRTEPASDLSGFLKAMDNYKHFGLGLSLAPRWGIKKP